MSLVKFEKSSATNAIKRGRHWRFRSPMGLGLLFGIEARSGKHIMYDPDQGGICPARSLMRLPDSQKFEYDRAAPVSAMPWSTHAAERPRRVLAEKTVEPDDAKPDDVAKVLGIYIKKEDFEAFGYTPGCKRCRSAFHASLGCVPTSEYGRTQKDPCGGSSSRTNDNTKR